jgi:hypothetical protein
MIRTFLFIFPVEVAISDTLVKGFSIMWRLFASTRMHVISLFVLIISMIRDISDC